MRERGREGWDESKTRQKTHVSFNYPRALGSIIRSPMKTDDVNNGWRAGHARVTRARARAYVCVFTRLNSHAAAVIRLTACINPLARVSQRAIPRPPRRISTKRRTTVQPPIARGGDVNLAALHARSHRCVCSPVAHATLPSLPRSAPPSTDAARECARTQRRSSSIVAGSGKGRGKGGRKRDLDSRAF